MWLGRQIELERARSDHGSAAMAAHCLGRLAAFEAVFEHVKQMFST